jgi:hypothetical protein
MNSTNWSAITSFDGLLTEANRFAPFWLGILLMLWAVLIITFLPYGTSVAVLGGSFLALLLGILLAYMNLVAWKWVMYMAGVIVFIVIVEALFAKKDQ